MSNPLNDSEKVTDAMQAVAEALVEHLGVLPDAVVLLRYGGICRTLFAANPENGSEHPRMVLTALLEEATLQNRSVNEQIERGLNDDGRRHTRHHS